MEDLKLYNLLLVGEAEDKAYFEEYFQEIYLIKNNIQAFNFYSMYKPLIIFFYCDEKVFNALSIIEKIREHDRETILVIVAKEKKVDTLIDALPLHLSGYIEKPFQKNKVEKVLEHISHDLDLLYEHRVKLKGNYTFNRKQNILYNREKKEVKLTKNEIKLMTLMSASKEQYISSEQIEHTIWAEDSAFEDCHTRLKALLYGLRRKLPKNSIMNSYSTGYKLACI
jgi:DNA-binding response OmpR family regulator